LYKDAMVIGSSASQAAVSSNAREKLEISKGISQRQGLDVAQAYAEIGLCRLSILERDIPKAKTHIKSVEKLIESLDDLNDRVARYYQLSALIEIEDKDFNKAKFSAERALTVARAGELPEKEVEALRILGILDVKIGRFEQAQISLIDSLELAKELNDRFSEARTNYEQGLLFWNWSKSGTPSQLDHLNRAETSFKTAIRIFETLGAKHDLQLTKKALAVLPILEGGDEYGEKLFSGDSKIDERVSLLRSHLNLSEGEWHQATIISVILIPRQGMDDELIFETTAFLIPPITNQIQENGGHVIRHQDGITAIFGGVVTHEDDPERAVETAMEITNFYNELDQQTELPVSIRLGIDMGKIVGGMIELDQNSEFMAVGLPVQNARKLAEACPSGRVWVTQSVRNIMSHHFEFSSISTDPIKSLSNLPLFELDGLREQMLPVRGLIGLKSPFIGRKKELDAMSQMSLVLDGGSGAIIWIEGEAGIGKSRLMREFSDHLAQRGALVLIGTCTVRRSEYAFSLFSDLLLQSFDIQHNYSPIQINEQINQKLDLLPQDLLETRPFLQLLMGVQPSGALGERISAMEPEQLRQQTFVAIHKLIGALASVQPVVLILDDLQWIDSISADLLLYLSYQVVSQRVLLVCAQRKKEISPFEKILARTRSMHPENFVHLSIKPLTIEECQLLLGEFLSFADLPGSILSLIVQQSGGNPYYLEEFVRLLVEKDFLLLERGHLIANHTMSADDLVVPTSLESLIRARVDSLEAPAKQLLQVASVIGHRFDRELLEKVADRNGIDMILTFLHTRGMLFPTSEEKHWEFSHPLIEVIVYNTVLRAQRRILHQRTASALEEQWRGNEGEHAEDLAYHFGKAENHEKALHYLILAGERAATRHANDVAVSFFEQAAELQSAVPSVSDEARLRIIRGMGEVYQFIGNYDTSLAVLQSGLDLLESDSLSPAQRAGIYRRMGDTAHKKGDQEQAVLFLKQALDIIGDPVDIQSQVEASLIYARLGWCLFMQSEFEKAEDAVMTSRVFAGKADNITTLAMTENYLGGIHFRQGELQDAIQHTRIAMEYWQEIGYSWGVAAALSNLGVLEIESGNWQAAFNSIKRSLKLRQEMGDVDGVAITNHNLGHLSRIQGNVKQAEHFYRDSLAVSRPFQMNWHAANSFVGLAQSLLYQGDIDSASEFLLNGLRLAEEINAPDVIVEAFCTSAELHLAKEAYVEAEQSAQRAAELAKEIGDSTLLATASRLISASLLEQGHTSKASCAMDEAWEALPDRSEGIEEGRLHAQEVLIALAVNDQNKVKIHREAAERIFLHLGASRDFELLRSI